MNSRYFTNLVLAVAGGFLIVASQAWSVPVFMWIMFGIGIIAMVLSTSIALPGRGLLQRGLDGAVSVLGAWTIIASLVFAGATVTWLGFASGCAFVGLALAGLTLHELRTERVVHSLEVRSPRERELAGMS